MTPNQLPPSVSEALEILERVSGLDDDPIEAFTAVGVLRDALAAIAQQAQPVHQFRRQLCADWYDGHPDHEDGGGPYETRIPYTTPPAPQVPAKCLTCSGHGEIGGHMPDGSGHGEPCPACNAPQPAAPVVSGWSIDDHRDGSVTIETPEGRIISLHRSGGSGMESTAYSLALLALRPAVEPMTDEQIVQGQEQQGAQSILSFMKGVRFAEAHHGITAKAEGGV